MSGPVAFDGICMHLLQVHLHAPNPSGLDCNCSTVMLAFLSSTHCSHAGHLEWIDSPQQWFKVTLQTLRKPYKIAQGTPHHKQVCGYSASAERLFCRVTWFPKTIKPVPRAERSWCHSNFTHNARQHPTVRPYLEISRITHALLCTRQHDVHPTIVGQESWFAWTRSEHRVGFIDIHRISITVTMNEWFGNACRIQKLHEIAPAELHHTSPLTHSYIHCYVLST